MMQAIHSKNPLPGSPDDPLRVKLTPRIWAIFAALLVLGAIEIRFSGISWNTIYPLLKNTLDFLEGFFANAEQYVGTYTITTILLVVWIFDRRFRRTIVPYLVALLIMSTVVTVVKSVTGRARPMYGWKMETEQKKEIREYLGLYDNPIIKPEPGDYWTWLSKDRPGTEVIGWFTGETPWGERHEELSVGDYSSFPSGHSAGSFLLAAYLAHLYPKGSILWYILAFGCAFSRVRFRRHYPGDIIVGGAFGWFSFYLFFSMPWVLRLGAWAERVVTPLIERTPPPGQEEQEAQSSG